MAHPLASRLAPLMESDLDSLRSIVAECVVETSSEQERAALRAFGCELGAVQRRIRNRRVPPTCEEVEIALTAVLALVSRKSQSGADVRVDPAELAREESRESGGEVALKGPASS